MSRLIINNSTYLDIHSGVYKENQSIVMKDRKFAWIGDENDYEKEDNDKIIDGSGKFVLPGLIDCHVHLEFSAEVDFWKKELNTPTNEYTFIALMNAQRQVISGFTTVRDVGSFANSYPAVKNTINEMQFAGSRVIGSAEILLQKGRQERELPDNINYSSYEAESGPIGMRDAVRKRIEKGADWIKIEATGGVLHGKHSVLDQSFFADDELDAIVAEAHRMNRFVCAHAHGDDGIYRSTKAGINTIEHGSFISEESAKLMVEKGNYLIPTKIAVAALMEPEVFETMTPEIQARLTDASSQIHLCQKQAYEIGVKFALGTDAGTPRNYHGTSAKEIELMMEKLEVSSTKAIQMASIEAAKAIKLDHLVGSIEVNKAADLVIIDNDPIDHIKSLQNYKNLSHVIRDGEIMAERGRIVYSLNLN